MIPLMTFAHKGPELHCYVDSYQTFPCFDDKQGIIIDKNKETPVDREEKQEIELVQVPPALVRRDHFIEWFPEGVLVCGTSETENLIAKELLLDPHPDWMYGIPKLWKDMSNVRAALRELGSEYYCRYTLYR